MRSKFVRFQLRDLLFIALPALLIVIGVIWFALRFVNPAPPGTLVLSAATSGSPYYRYAERYQATFERNGVKLEIREWADHWPISRHFPIQPQVWMQASFKEA